MCLNSKGVLILGFFCYGVFIGGIKHADAATTSPDKVAPDLFSLDIEALQTLRVKVTSPSKKEQDLFKAASAISVITSEDIRRSGATSLPDLLRMGPGTDVAHFTSQKWMVSVRGFNQIYSNKLLVLVDGRTVYTPLFGGVYWEVQDYPLEDIERIEIIRGPGATLWGADAVNGIINIISKDSSKTQGNLLSAEGGNTERVYLARHGGKVNDHTYYRFYAKYAQRDPLVDTAGHSNHDDWDIKSTGFQVDGGTNRTAKWMLQGRAYRGGGDILSMFPTLPPVISLDKNKFNGGHLLGRWQYSHSEISHFSLQTYFDRTYRDENRLYQEGRSTGDIDFQHQYILAKQDIVWGVGYRVTRDQKLVPGLFIVRMDPPHRTESTYSAFIQDEINLKDNFHLIIGSKFERNVYTVAETQPSIRFLWLPDENHSVWGAVSRAVRTPTRTFSGDSTLDLTSLAAGTLIPGVGPLPVPLLVKLSNSKFGSERLTAFELGYRVRPRNNLFMDITVFANQYRKVQGGIIGMPFFLSVPSPHLVVPVQFSNGMALNSHGLEGLGQWKVFPQWKLQAAYSFLKLLPKRNEADLADVKAFLKASGPAHQFQLHSYWELPNHWELGVMGYYVGRLTPLPSVTGGGQTPGVPQYIRFDARLAWRPIPSFLLEVVGQDLQKAHYTQARSPETYLGGDARRAAYIRATLNL